MTTWVMHMKHRCGMTPVRLSTVLSLPSQVMSLLGWQKVAACMQWRHSKPVYLEVWNGYVEVVCQVGIPDHSDI
jgi:hypothetical protein